MIAIHTVSGSFAPKWVSFCQENDIPYKEVNCFSSDVMAQLQGCRSLLWHWEHNDSRAQLFARQLIASVEKMGLSVFPGTDTSWHYDDKVGQKYLLEAIGAPLVPTHVFYDRDSAARWVENTKFPVVWKLRGGAGSQNVRLVAARQAARQIIKRSFEAGWKGSRFHQLRDRIWHFRRDRSWLAFLNISRGIFRAVFPHRNMRRSVPQQDYVYFQDFIPENSFDIRVVVIGDRGFAVKRMAREGDFRASGSGALIYDKDQIPLDCVITAFAVTTDLRSQCCAYDFVRLGDTWLIVEISYMFTPEAYTKCPGYWDSSLNWHAKPVTPEVFVLQDVLKIKADGNSDDA